MVPMRSDRREEKPTRKRLSPPARTISPDIKRVKKERKSEDREVSSTIDIFRLSRESYHSFLLSCRQKEWL
jgi:hypothetical protein